jgi:O-acetyl-ADP-ribose deacetylase (regulator of RNase III)/ADP-ribose pyrophosphatase YjhB (NUDIX family)
MEEKKLYSYKYPRPALTVDCVVFDVNKEENTVKVLLIQRKNPPFKDCWAFAGGFVNMDETTEQAAQRELFEETHLKDIDLIQYHTYSKVDRDPRGRTVTVVYYGFVDSRDMKDKIQGDDDAKQAQWFLLEDLPPLAFDHDTIIKDVVKDCLGKDTKKEGVIEIKLGDITKCEVDAIVNAANCSLLGGGGVDGAIHRAAGKGLYEECLTLGGCKTGEAKITKGYNLPAKHVIHTPGPVYRDGKHNEDELLASCYRNCMLLAEKYHLKTICFPSISTGVYRFPVQKAAKIAINTIKQTYKSCPTIEKVTMICFDEDTFEAYNTAIREEE